MIELRILGVGIEAEIGAAIALEIEGQTYASLHDKQGHVSCLIDAKTGEVVETYRYSAFGEETILDKDGNAIETTAVNNPWRFSSKRHDPETGWIYFGRRYYDPEIGRWTTPDPLSFDDGPNLYAYLHHNPLNAFDAYGLEAEGFNEAVGTGHFDGNHFTASVSISVSVYQGVERTQSQSSDRASYLAGSPSYTNSRSSSSQNGPSFFTRFTSAVYDFVSPVFSAFNHPRVQGGMTALAGLGEAAIGAYTVGATAGLGAIGGGALVAHGIDNYVSGCNQMFSGNQQDSLTVQGLTNMGMSHSNASLASTQSAFLVRWALVQPCSMGVLRGQHILRWHPGDLCITKRLAKIML